MFHYFIPYGRPSLSNSEWSLRAGRANPFPACPSAVSFGRGMRTPNKVNTAKISVTKSTSTTPCSPTVTNSAPATASEINCEMASAICTI